MFSDVSRRCVRGSEEDRQYNQGNEVCYFKGPCKQECSRLYDRRILTSLVVLCVFVKPRITPLQRDAAHVYGE